MAIVYGTNASNSLGGTAGDDQIFGWLQANPPGDEGPVTDAYSLFGGPELTPRMVGPGLTICCTGPI